MKKLLIVGTITLIATLFVGSIVYPDSLLMVFASTEVIHSVFRVGLILLLGSLLFIRPPRALAFRILLVTASALLMVASLGMLFGSNGHMLDATVYLEGALIFLVEALELSTDRIDNKPQARRLVKQ